MVKILNLKNNEFKNKYGFDDPFLFENMNFKSKKKELKQLKKKFLRV
jgi:hypothetical protein